MKNEWIKRTVIQHSRALEAREYSSIELTCAYLERIEECDGEVGAFLTVDAEGALRAANESDKRRAHGNVRGTLDGIPYAVKDNFCTRGLRTTCASRMLEHFVPPYDATAVTKLRDAGCVLLGKLNMDEFAMGSSSEFSAFGATRNPHNINYISGGSSSGSAAAVAAYEAPFTLGSDTGGSVRQPAAFCGAVGLKPTYGAISRYGMIALASSLDCVGIVSHDVSDASLLLSALIGKDGKDMTVCTHPFSNFAENKTFLDRPLRIAVVRELMIGHEISNEVTAAVENAMDCLRANGALIGEVSLPSPEEALAAYCVLSAAEASSNMARFDGVRYGARNKHADELFSMYADSRAENLGDEVKRRILFGNYMLSEKNRPLYYDAAVLVRNQIRESLLQTLKEYDLLLTPMTPDAARPIDTVLTAAQKRRADLCAVYANLAGLPAISVPFGKNSDGMPLAVQLTAAPFGENVLFEAAKLLEDHCLGGEP